VGIRVFFLLGFVLGVFHLMDSEQILFNLFHMVYCGIYLSTVYGFICNITLLLCLNCTYVCVLYDYDLFHTCIILLTYGSIECSFFVCACVYMYVCPYITGLLARL
jgi:hypothetical protein